eukprot:4282830-Alexandrium_andersonii.AAC.1
MPGMKDGDQAAPAAERLPPETTLVRVQALASAVRTLSGASMSSRVSACRSPLRRKPHRNP